MRWTVESRQRHVDSLETSPDVKAYLSRRIRWFEVDPELKTPSVRREEIAAFMALSDAAKGVAMREARKMGLLREYSDAGLDQIERRHRDEAAMRAFYDARQAGRRAARLACTAARVM